MGTNLTGLYLGTNRDLFTRGDRGLRGARGANFTRGAEGADRVNGAPRKEL